MSASRLTISKLRGKKPAKLRERIQILRESADLTMREVEEHSGVSAPTICRIESGKCPDVITALKLARFFEKSVEELFGHLEAAHE